MVAFVVLSSPANAVHIVRQATNKEIAIAILPAAVPFFSHSHSMPVRKIIFQLTTREDIIDITLLNIIILGRLSGRGVFDLDKDVVA